jgi:hypothetical protein
MKVSALQETNIELFLLTIKFVSKNERMVHHTSFLFIAVVPDGE